MTLRPGERLLRLWRGREPRGGRSRRGARREPEVIEEIAAEFTTEELQEFLEAGNAPVPADPVFKEQLREKLWEMVQEKRRHDAPDDDA